MPSIRVLLSLAATLAAGADDGGKPSADGTTALHRAVQAGDHAAAQRLLREGAAVNAATRNGVTPLLLAAINADPVMVETLLKAGADPNASLSRGQTILMTAARTGSDEAVRLLLARGADVNAREQILGETALIWAAAENHPAVIKALVEHGADVNGRSKAMTYPRREYGDGKSGRLTVLPPGSWTPIMYAARQNAIDAVRALADARADLDLTDPDGTTALVVAIINAHYDLAAVLLEKGADPNVGDVTGMTPLYAAVDLNTFPDTPGRPAPKPAGKLDALDIVKALLAHGANPNARLKAPILVRVHDRGDGTLGEGATPLMRAAKKSDVDPDAAAARQGRRPGADHQDRGHGSDVCVRLRRRGTIRRVRRTARDGGGDSRGRQTVPRGGRRRQRGERCRTDGAAFRRHRTRRRLHQVPDRARRQAGYQGSPGPDAARRRPRRRRARPRRRAAGP